MRRPPHRSAATWTSALERYRRAVERYHESVRLMSDHTLRRELTHVASPLDAVLEDLEHAADRGRSYDAERAEQVLAHIRRAATLCAHATEAALMADEATRHHEVEDVATCLDTVRVLIKKIDEIGDEVNPQW
jgi:type II secretory pathway component GspD/PulD (secretin)